MPAHSRNSTIVNLISPNIRRETAFRKALAELTTERDRTSLIYLGAQSEEFDEISFKEYVERLIQYKTNPPPRRSPGIVYWAIEAESIIGRIAVRFDADETGGHVGYYVIPSCRNQGFATKILKLLLETTVAREIGRILITCDEDNLPSERVILKNGGRFENLIDVASDRPRKKRFWIDI
ncbi:Acetyltransferase (GNAT) family protein [Polystyrenella longa]|uniref:Acetyltransferase (GNAT) family protein n=1 Tax=Polystyrenella longa TaxID=2528007 RepID=A0A518CKW6_9PLAN|nr:Acetyltransferase (GNAT) family protein [Polystyrenella longa]